MDRDKHRLFLLPKKGATVGQKLLRLKQVLERVPVSKSSWWAGVRSGKYPKGRKLGPKTTVWLESDIDTIVHGETANAA